MCTENSLFYFLLLSKEIMKFGSDRDCSSWRVTATVLLLSVFLVHSGGMLAALLFCGVGIVTFGSFFCVCVCVCVCVCKT